MKAGTPISETAVPVLWTCCNAFRAVGSALIAACRIGSNACGVISAGAMHATRELRFKCKLYKTIGNAKCSHSHHDDPSDYDRHTCNLREEDREEWIG